MHRSWPRIRNACGRLQSTFFSFGRERGGSLGRLANRERAPFPGTAASAFDHRCSPAGEAVMRTRKGLDWTSDFTGIADAARSLDDCIIDGEVVALDHNGAP